MVRVRRLPELPLRFRPTRLRRHLTGGIVAAGPGAVDLERIVGSDHRAGRRPVAVGVVRDRRAVVARHLIHGVIGVHH